MTEGETIPAIPSDYRFRPLATLSVNELREKAAHYRRMAATATTAPVMSALLKLAEQLSTLADRRERGE